MFELEIICCIVVNINKSVLHADFVTHLLCHMQLG